MTTIDASELLRPGVLRGVSIVVAGADEAGAPDRAAAVGAAVSAACSALGARVSEWALGSDATPELEQARLEEALDGVLAAARSVDLLAVDGASLFGSALGGEPAAARAALRRCVDASWNVTRALAERAFLPDSRGGRIVYIAPAPDAGEHADAARAGLENLARTLSIEWARHGVTVVTIALGGGGGGGSSSSSSSSNSGSSSHGPAAASEAAALTAYLASPAGAYFSGCLLDLRGPSPA